MVGEVRIRVRVRVSKRTEGLVIKELESERTESLVLIVHLPSRSVSESPKLKLTFMVTAGRKVSFLMLSGPSWRIAL